jgi:pimeloyl-ACP methyl ester carboxylesterase
VWENPSFAEFLRKLSSFSRLVLYDRLGNGLSDRGPTGHAFEDEIDDVRSVLEAAGSKRAALLGRHVGGRLALLLAATYPDQVPAVVTFGSHPATLRDDDHPWGTTPEELEGLLATIRSGVSALGAGELLAAAAPGEATDPSVQHWWSMFVHTAASPVELHDGIKSLGPVDIRQLLGSIHLPVLVLSYLGGSDIDRLDRACSSGQGPRTSGHRAYGQADQSGPLPHLSRPIPSTLFGRNHLAEGGHR